MDWAEKLAAGLASLGVQKGDRVAIVSGNRIEWALMDYATMALGAMLVPVYPSLLDHQLRYIVNDCEAKVLIAEDDLQVAKVNNILSELNTVKKFFVFDPPEQLVEPWKKLTALVEAGEDFLKKNPDYVTNEIKKIAREDWATIIYTSGTTGEPKGAVLKHGNFLSNIEGAMSVLDIYTEDVFLSFLPLSHVFERMAGHFLSNHQGQPWPMPKALTPLPKTCRKLSPLSWFQYPVFTKKFTPVYWKM